MGRSRTKPKWNEGKRKEVEEERGEAVELGGGGDGSVRGNVSERSDLCGGGCGALLGGG